MEIYIKATFETYPNGYYTCNDIKKLYHWVCSDAAMAFVLENGIVADDQYSVYLSAKPLFTDKGHLFEVTIPDNSRLYDWRFSWWNDNGEEFDSDHHYEADNPYFIYEGNIPKEYVKLLW